MALPARYRSSARAGATDDGRWNVRIGLMSDTHGVIDEAALDALRGVDVIVHAGDVGSAEVLWRLQAVAPVIAVAGNCDRVPFPGWDLPPVASPVVGGVRLLVIHDLADLGPIPDGVDVVVCGHSHRPRDEWHGSVRVLNPGSASQRRSQPYRTVGVLEAVDGATGRFELIELPQQQR